MKSTPTSPRTTLLNAATVSAALLAAVIFVIDLSTPAGHGIAALYALPLLVGTFNEPPRFQLVAAAVVSALTLVGAAFSPALDAYAPIASRPSVSICFFKTCGDQPCATM